MPADPSASLPKAAQATQLIYLRAPNPSNKPPACEACQQRKRKCDRKQPKCSGCEKRNIVCTIEARSMTDLRKDVVQALKEKDQHIAALETRIAALEELIRSQMPDLAHTLTLSTNIIASLTGTTAAQAQRDSFVDSSLPASQSTSREVSPFTVSSRTDSAVASPEALALRSTVRNDTQSPSVVPERLTPELIAWVEEQLCHVQVGHGVGIQSTVLRHITWQLPINDKEAEGDGGDVPPAAWPPYELAIQVVDTFVQGNSPWPVFRRGDLMREFEAVYQHGTIVDPDASATPLQTYKGFLIFSIACAWMALGGNGQRVNTALLRNRALDSLPTVLRTEDPVDCVEALFLLTLTGVHDWGGADVVQLLPIVGHLAMAIGLHKDPPAHVSQDEKDRRRLVFWGIFCLDRAVAGNLCQKPFLPDVPVVLPSRMDTVSNVGAGADPLFFAQHILNMWCISTEVGAMVHQQPTDEEIGDMHRRLNEWYARSGHAISPIPPVCPGPSPVTQVPSSSASAANSPASAPAPPSGSSIVWDQYYNFMISVLYRPRTSAAPPIEHLRILQASTSTALRLLRIMSVNGQMFDNYYQYNFTLGMGVTLLCTLLLFGGNEANAWDPVWCANAITQVRETQTLIGQYCQSWPFARNLSRAFDSLAGSTVDRITSVIQTSPSGISVFNAHLLNAKMSLAANDLTGLTLSVPDAPPAPQLSIPANEARKMWFQDCLVSADNYGGSRSRSSPSSSSNVSGISAEDLNALLGTLGGSQDWVSYMVAGAL